MAAIPLPGMWRSMLASTTMLIVAACHSSQAALAQANGEINPPIALDSHGRTFSTDNEIPEFQMLGIEMLEYEFTLRNESNEPLYYYGSLDGTPQSAGYSIANGSHEQLYRDGCGVGLRKHWLPAGEVVSFRLLLDRAARDQQIEVDLYSSSGVRRVAITRLEVE